MPADVLVERIAQMLHHRKASLAEGDPLPAPIVPASVYMLPGDPSGPYQYGRWSNPTWGALEEALGTLEDAECLVFPAGMSAIAAVLYVSTKQGDRVLLPADGYYSTRSFVEKYLERFGVGFDLVATSEIAKHSLAGYRLIWIETPSNPGLNICDIREISLRGKADGALVIVDNTTATPLGQCPLDLGADIVVSSDTKAVGGHSDVLLGHVATRNPRLLGSLRDWRSLAGAIPGPFEAWLVHRSLETLELRFDRMCNNAEAIASRLAEHPAPTSVCYPGLSSHPGHAIAKEQMRRFGAMIGLTLRSREAAEKFIREPRFVEPITSFGGNQTSAERRQRWGEQVDPGFIRLSIGCEPLEPLWREMLRVLDSV